MPTENITPINEEDVTAFVTELNIKPIKKEEEPEKEEKIVIKLPEWDLVPPNEIVDRSEEND